MSSKCPECGSAKVAEIVYGLPSSDWDWEKDVDAGRVRLGGCCVPPDPSPVEVQLLRPRVGETEDLGHNTAPR